MSTQVDTRVTPSLSPEVVRAIKGYNDETGPFVGDVVDAFNDLFVTLHKVHAASDLWKRNPTTTPEQRVLIVSKEANKWKERVTRRIDKAHDDLKKRIAHTESELSRPLTEQAGQGTLNAEVRAHAKGLKRDERAKLINEAIASNDEATLGALLGAQPFLSGLSREEQALHLHSFHSQKNPHLVARLEVMKGALEVIYRSGALIHSQFASAIGAPPQEVAAIDAANEAALASLKTDAA